MVLRASLSEWNRIERFETPSFLVIYFPNKN